MSLPNPTPQQEHLLYGMALFAGYGGLELGIDAAFGGCRTVCYVERESYAAATLVARMAEEAIHPAPIWDDVTTLDGRPWRGVVDIISAGFPCQPFSAAGKRQGQADERWLWDDIERLLREVRPRWFVGENVPGLVSLGLGPVLRSLAVLGYDAEWGLLRASDVGASHRRERIFIFAKRRDSVDQTSSSGGRHADEEVCARRNSIDDAGRELADATRARSGLNAQNGDRREDTGRGGKELVDRNSQRFIGQRGQHAVTQTSCAQLGDTERRRQHGGAEKHTAPNTTTGGRGLFAPGPQDFDLWARVLAETPQIEPSVCGVADGSAAELDYRQDRLRACGNGVVPLQAAAAICALADRAGWDLIP